MSHYSDDYEDYNRKCADDRLNARKREWPKQYNIQWNGMIPEIHDCWYDKKLSIAEIVSLLNKNQ